MKLLYVHSGDDYAAITFEQEYGGRMASEIIQCLEDPKLDGKKIRKKYDKQGIELDIIEVGEVDKRFRKFFREEFQDYDQSKNKNFYFEDETIQ